MLNNNLQMVSRVVFKKYETGDNSLRGLYVQHKLTVIEREHFWPFYFVQFNLGNGPTNDTTTWQLTRPEDSWVFLRKVPLYPKIFDPRFTASFGSNWIYFWLLINACIKDWEINRMGRRFVLLFRCSETVNVRTNTNTNMEVDCVSIIMMSRWPTGPIHPRLASRRMKTQINYNPE